jgi:hypothetical protein
VGVREVSCSSRRFFGFVRKPFVMSFDCLLLSDVVRSFVCLFSSVYKDRKVPALSNRQSTLFSSLNILYHLFVLLDLWIIPPSHIYVHVLQKESLECPLECQEHSNPYNLYNNCHSLLPRPKQSIESPAPSITKTRTNLRRWLRESMPKRSKVPTVTYTGYNLALASLSGGDSAQMVSDVHVISYRTNLLTDATTL